MLVPFSNPYKYYLHKTCVATYRNDVCPLKFAFPLVGSSKILEKSLEYPRSREVKSVLKLWCKTVEGRPNDEMKVALRTLTRGWGRFHTRSHVQVVTRG